MSPLIAPMSRLVPSPVALFDTADGGAVDARYYADHRFIRLRRGIYALRTEYEALPPWSRYLARVHAFARRRPDAILAGTSAAAVTGLPTFGEPRHIHVFDHRRTARSRVIGDVVVHTGRDDRGIRRVDGILLTSPAHTALDAMRLARPAFAVAIGDAALVSGHGPPSHSGLIDLAASQSASRGRTLLGQVLPLLDARSESPGESVSRAVITWLGYETPELQVEFRWKAGVDRADFHWFRCRATAEFDGLAKYLMGGSDDTARRVIEEKHREDRLRRSCRAFARWGWSDATRVDPLECRLIEMGIPRVCPRREALLRSTWSGQ